MKIKNHLDFEKNSQLINIKLHQVSSLPTGWTGGFVYLTTDNKVYYFNGTAWIAINDTSGLITNVTAGGGITVSVTNGIAKVTLDPDNSGLELSGAGDDAKARIKDAGVTSIKLADKAVTFQKIQDVVSMTVIGRVEAGSGVASAVTILTNLNTIIAAHDSLASAKAVKDYVDSVVGGLGSLVGGFNASTATDFPANAKKGDYWYVTHQGSVRGVNFHIGDVLIANKTGASVTLPADWIFLEVNRDQASATVLGVVMLATQAEARAMTDTTKALTPSNLSDVKASNAETQTGTAADRFVTPASLSSRTATESRTGLAAVATQAEVNAGTDDTKMVTSAKLKVYAEGLVAVYGRFSADVGNGSATSIVVTHALNTRDVLVEVWDNLAHETVLTDVQRNTVNQVTLSFAVAPSANQYRVNIRR